MFDAAKAKIILSSGVVLHCEIIPISAFANGFKNILKARWLIQLEGLGLVIAKQSDDVYSFVYKGVEIFKGTKAEAETALKEYFENSKKRGLERYLDEVKLIKNIPGIKNFSKWFDEISILDFEKIWTINKAKSKISGLIRHPGGLHEWLMCSRANVFKKWGVEMSEIKELRTRIEEVIFKNPPGYHGGPGSTKAHNEILELIDDSKNYEEFKGRLIDWSENRLKNGKNDLPNGFFK